MVAGSRTTWPARAGANSSASRRTIAADACSLVWLFADIGGPGLGVLSASLRETAVVFSHEPHPGEVALPALQHPLAGGGDARGAVGHLLAADGDGALLQLALRVRARG